MDLDLSERMGATDASDGDSAEQKPERGENEPSTSGANATARTPTVNLKLAPFGKSASAGEGSSADPQRSGSDDLS